MSNLETQKHIINSLTEVSDQALQELRNYLEIYPPTIPIANVLGANIFGLVGANFVDDVGSTTSTTYTDLATVGPTIGGLPDGEYLFLFGAISDTVSPGVDSAQMALSFDGSDPSLTSHAAITAVGNPGQSIMVATNIVFETGSVNNGAQAKYRSQLGALAEFEQRWMVAFRWKNG